MRLELHEKHGLLSFDSIDDWAEVVDNNAPDYLKQRVPSESSWFGGAKDWDELTRLARKGLTQEGIDALRLSEQNIQDMDRDLIAQTFKSRYSETGSDVDVARYLAGEQECMIDYYQSDITNNRRVVTLAVGIAVHCGISASAVTKHGQALMALVEAIDRCGLQTEMWADITIRNGPLDGNYTARIKVLMKSPGGTLDPTAFMYILTHVGAFRGLGLGACHEFPLKWREALSFCDGGYYGQPVNEPYRIEEDYPEETIYIPSLSSNDEAGKALPATLKKLNLINA